MPRKVALDWFKHEVNMRNDPKLKHVERKFGITGYGVYNKLLEEVYSTGYFLEWPDWMMESWAEDNRVDVETLRQMFKCFFDIGLFDKDLFDKHGILTSKAIQERYAEAVKRSLSITIVRPYWIDDSTLDPIRTKHKVTYVGDDVLPAPVTPVETKKPAPKPKMVDAGIDYDMEISKLYERIDMATRPWVKAFIDAKAKENKSGKMGQQLVLRHLTELDILRTSVNNDTLFRQALAETAGNGVGNIVYLKKVIASYQKKGGSFGAGSGDSKGNNGYPKSEFAGIGRTASNGQNEG